MVKILDKNINFLLIKKNRDFINAGYKGLYGGLSKNEIYLKKGLRRDKFLENHMETIEWAANIFRITQTDEKLVREKIRGKKKAKQVNFQVGLKVRQTIKELGGTMPEDLPIPEKSIRKVEGGQKRN